MSFVGQFIDKYYLRQSKRVQTITFVVFVLLFAYGFVNILQGKYVLKGNLLAESSKKCGQSGCINYAAYYGVRWGTDDFASNSKGEYYVALGFGDYLRALVGGSHEIKFLQLDPRENKELLVWHGDVTIHRMDGEFADVTIPYTPPPLDSSPSPPGAENLQSPDTWSVLVPSVWASEAQQRGMYQLLVQGVRLASGSKVDATIELNLGGQMFQMGDRSMSDLPAGRIPIAPNQNLDLGSNLYFPIPTNTLPVQGQVRLSAPATGFLQISGYSEDFQLPSQQKVGDALQMTGSRGSSLFVRIVYSQPVKLFRELDWAQRKDATEAEFLSQGFLVRWADPPLGSLAETNALWTGPSVGFDVVQRLLRVVIDQMIPLKKIEYRYHFQTTQNPTEMQLGSSGACANAAPIAKDALENAIAAQTEEGFQRVISPFTCQASPNARIRARQRTR